MITKRFTVLQPGGTDKNGRRYNAYEVYVQLRRKMKEGFLIGELGHGDFDRFTTIGVDNVSHRVVDLELKEDHSIEADIEILDTPMGKIAQQVVDGLTTSLRSVGSVSRDRDVSDLEVVTIDLTQDVFDDAESPEQED